MSINIFQNLLQPQQFSVTKNISTFMAFPTIKTTGSVLLQGMKHIKTVQFSKKRNFLRPSWCGLQEQEETIQSRMCSNPNLISILWTLQKLCRKLNNLKPLFLAPTASLYRMGLRHILTTSLKPGVLKICLHLNLSPFGYLIVQTSMLWITVSGMKWQNGWGCSLFRTSQV